MQNLGLLVDSFWLPFAEKMNCQHSAVSFLFLVNRIKISCTKYSPSPQRNADRSINCQNLPGFGWYHWNGSDECLSNTWYSTAMLIIFCSPKTWLYLLLLYMKNWSTNEWAKSVNIELNPKMALWITSCCSEQNSPKTKQYSIFYVSTESLFYTLEFPPKSRQKSHWIKYDLDFTLYLEPISSSSSHMEVSKSLTAFLMHSVTILNYKNIISNKHFAFFEFFLFTFSWFTWLLFSLTVITTN